MQNMMIDTPEQLKELLCGVCPELASELEEDVEYDIGYKEPLNYHRVWLAFAPLSYKCLNQLNKKSLKQVCEVINHMVVSGGVKENAVSTCLLEHASQLKIRKIIKPYLSAPAKAEVC